MLADVVAAIGTDGFYRAIYQGMREHFGACQMIVLRHHAARAVAVLAAEADDHHSVHERVSRYTDVMRDRDPLLASLVPSARRHIEVRRIETGQIQDRQYRQALYCAGGLTGQLSMIVRDPAGATTLSIYRGHAAGPFQSCDLAALHGHSAVLAAALERHGSLRHQPLPSTDGLARLIAGLPACRRLSTREASVCARVALGESNMTIAQSLAISFHSVSTYRRRAYAKLGIGSQAELLSLLVRQPGPVSLMSAPGDEPVPVGSDARAGAFRIPSAA